MALHQYGVDAGETYLNEYLSVWDLPLDVEEFPEICGVKVVQLSGMALAHQVLHT